MTTDAERIQKILDEAFAKFKADFPSVAHSIEIMKLSYAEYLTVLSKLSNEIPTRVGNAVTPP
jgi:hypothetical protein